MSRRPSWIPPRKAIPKRLKTEAWEQADGRCQACGITLHGGDHAYDHVLPVALGGKNELSNVQVLCDGCHVVKTSADIERIAKADRQGRRSGRQKPGKQKQKIQGRGFDRRFKKKLDGTVELRPAGEAANRVLKQIKRGRGDV